MCGLTLNNFFCSVIDVPNCFKVKVKGSCPVGVSEQSRAKNGHCM